MRDSEHANLRIGAVPYGVGAPLVSGLGQRTGIELVVDAPSRLIGRLRDGRLDAALVSSIEGFRRPGYGALEGVGICCCGAVRSVRAFRRRGTPIRRVGLDVSSETSAALLRIILADQPGLEFERIEPTRNPDELPHDLVMLIGDHGLRADPGAREVLDLGALWHERTGLPFVFALWLIAPGAPADAIAAELLAARERGRGSERLDGTGGAVHYDIGAAELEGLRRFHAEAARLGLARADLVPTFVTAGVERREGRHIHH